MKNWKLILLILGILFLVTSLGVYIYRIAGCYPPANVYSQYSPEYTQGFRQDCLLDSPVIIQFSTFLLLFIPGIILFSTYWLINRPVIKNRRVGQLSAFLLLLMFDSLLVMIYGMLGYPVPGNVNTPASWAVEAIAVLGFLCYLAALALWHWKRWGLVVFQGASVALAAFILLGGGSLVLAAVIVGGVIALSLVLRPLRNKLN